MSGKPGSRGWRALGVLLLGAIVSAAVLQIWAAWLPFPGWVPVLALLVVLAVTFLSLAKVANDVPSPQRAKPQVAWAVVGVLLTSQVVLSYLAAAAWLNPRGLFEWLFLSALAPQSAISDVLPIFERLVLSACAAGLGGGVYMLRELYIMYCFGRPDPDDPKNESKREWLQNEHALRYVLLPIAAFFLGPVILSLLMTGTISLTGDNAASPTEIPLSTIFGVSFVLGFAYHDTIGFLARLSRRILAKEDSNPG